MNEAMIPITPKEMEIAFGFEPLATNAIIEHMHATAARINPQIISVTRLNPYGFGGRSKC